MKIVVLMKQVFDTEAKITIDGSGKINKQGVSLIMNPYDEYAVELGLRIKEKLKGDVTVVSVGGPEVQDALRQCLAMGADKAILVDPGTDDIDEFTTATILAKAVGSLEYDIILGGFKAIDDGSVQVCGRVAEILGIPVVNVVTQAEVEDGKAVATCDIDGGSAVIEVNLPAVLTAQKGGIEPRYPSMKGIMQAKKKPMQKIGLVDIGLDAAQIAPKVKTLSFFMPAAREAGKIVPGEPAEAVCELARLLREEAKAI
ncbi:MAG: electron transfer flavoprotein subunit beta [Peptococcaceae bacterium BRH_c4b]|nr:MAG: electron transfer flavoprotein subunit beta [Peptococcaceae bacterium BRH_c4b]